MSVQPELDWTFDYIPGEEAVLPGPPRRARSVEAARPRLGRQGRPARRWWLPAALIAAVIFGARAVAWLGWERVQAQVRAEVLTEDEQARAGWVDLVLAFQARGHPAWLRLRAAETALGLAAPLPAPGLRPLDEPPRITRVRPAGPDLLEATVVRAYADSSGQRLEYTLVQRYYSPQPGLWERLPPDEASLAETAAWTGERVSATFPEADRPWLAAALPQVDAALAQACTDWACPPGLSVPLTIAGSLPALGRPTRPPANDGGGGHPLAFDLAPHLPRYPPRLVVPSPHLAGLPQDESSAQALVRGLAVQGLLNLAEQLAATTRAEGDYFLDALVARAELRLGLAPATQAAFTPEALVPPPGLWRSSLVTPASEAPNQHSLQLQTLAFLDFALAGQPPAREGGLLRSLRRHNALQTWLAAELGPPAAGLPDRWTAAAQRFVPAAAPAGRLAWPNLAGLAYTCEGGSWQVRAGGLLTLAAGTWGMPLEPHAFSQDSRYLAYLKASEAAGRQVVIDDFQTGRQQAFPGQQVAQLLGWSADNRLLYLERPEGDLAEGFPARLRRYDPATGQHETVIQASALPAWDSLSQWSTDHQQLALTLDLADPGQPQRRAPVVVALQPPSVDVEVLAEAGHGPALAPDGQSAAVVIERGEGSALEIVDLGNGRRRQLLDSRDLHPAQSASFSSLVWAPDGSRLAFLAGTAGTGQQLYTVAADGSALQQWSRANEARLTYPLGFSADGRYLAIYDLGAASVPPLRVIDLATGHDQRYEASFRGIAWSPRASVLAIASDQGLAVLDPATGQRRWLAFQVCQRAVWYY